MLIQDPDGTAATTMDMLLECWRETKSPNAAALIADFGAAAETSDARTLRATTKIDQDTWLQLVETTSIINRGALLASLANSTAPKVTKRIEALATLDADPRIVDALHALIDALPWVSTGSRPVWTRTFKLLAKLADPRTVAVARAFDPSSISSSWEGPGQWMADRLGKLEAKITLLDACTCLPALNKLSIAGTVDVQEHAISSELGRSVNWLHLSSPDTRSYTALVKVGLARRTGPGTLSLHNGAPVAPMWNCEMQLHRADDDSLSAVFELQPPSPTWQGAMTKFMDTLATAIESIADLSLHGIELVFTKKVSDTDTRQRLFNTFTVRGHDMADLTLRP